MPFTNPHIADTRRTLWDFFLWKAGFYDDRENTCDPPSDFQYPATVAPFDRDSSSALWIGHSTYLLDINGLIILTDPVWDTHCSPIRLSKFRRLSEPPILLADLPPIDLVLISHNHYDHLDSKTVKMLRYFHPQIEWIVPENLSPWFLRKGFEKVIELPWWKTHHSEKYTVTAVPAQHFSGRTLWDQNKTHWNGYVLETANPSKRVYFVGDTGYNPHDFRAIGEHWPFMDLSLIPIGTYVPHKFMKTVHIGPKEAVQIHRDVKSRLSFGMHWKTFKLSDEPLLRPPYDLYLEMEAQKLPHHTFLPLDIGVYANW